MKIGIIVQARISSTRLPKKIILPIGSEETFLDVLLKKLKGAFNDIPMLLATSEEKSNDVLEQFASKNDFLFFRGSENNVLKRFVDCSRKHKLDTVVRICSDNPFLDIDLLKILIDRYDGEDYFSYKINGAPAVLTHYGFFAEVVRVSALEEVLAGDDPFFIEHVTNGVYLNEDKFNIRFIEKIIEENYIRCTLDTKSDFDNLTYIYSKYYKENKALGYQGVIDFVSSEKELQNKMEQQILNNKK